MMMMMMLIQKGFQSDCFQISLIVTWVVFDTSVNVFYLQTSEKLFYTKENDTLLMIWHAWVFQ